MFGSLSSEGKQTEWPDMWLGYIFHVKSNSCQDLGSVSFVASV